VSEAALQSSFKPIIVVLGTQNHAIIERLKLGYVINDRWQEGMSSSIVKGLAAVLEQADDLENIILSVSDQPHIDASIFEALFEQKKRTGKGIISSRYAGISGTPVLFDKKYFPELLALTGDGGAKTVLQKNVLDMETIDFPLGQIDIDTKSDYHKLIKAQ